MRLMESRMRRKAHVRFGERDGRDRRVKTRYGAPVPTLRAPTPSSEDRHVTRRVDEGAKAIGLTLIDHLIITNRGRWHSMRSNGGW